MTGTPGTSEKRFERLRMLTEVSRALTYTTSIDEVLQLAVKRAAELVGADKSLLMLTDADGQLVVDAAYGVDRAAVEAFREPLDESLVRRIQALLDYRSEEGFLSVPLVVQGEVMGLLAAVRPASEPVTEDDEWLLSALADQAAVALENARLAHAVRQERAERGRSAEAQKRAQATLTHELRTPLSAIDGYCAILLEGVFDPLTDRQREAVGRIRRSGEHLHAVIENLLDMKQVSTGAVALDTREIPIRDVLTHVLDMLRPITIDKEQELRTNMEGNLVVSADLHRLQQALLNVVGNAIKYTPHGGTIQVAVSGSARGVDRFAAIAVTDDGPGIPAEALPTIFEAYERGEASDREGLGLGLHISWELIHAMGGSILVESRPGTGSTFTVFVPLAEGEA